MTPIISQCTALIFTTFSGLIVGVDF